MSNAEKSLGQPAVLVETMSGHASDAESAIASAVDVLASYQESPEALPNVQRFPGSSPRHHSVLSSVNKETPRTIDIKKDDIEVGFHSAAQHTSQMSSLLDEWSLVLKKRVLVLFHMYSVSIQHHIG
jgi:hypothetical protein